MHKLHCLVIQLIFCKRQKERYRTDSHERAISVVTLGAASTLKRFRSFFVTHKCFHCAVAYIKYLTGWCIFWIQPAHEMLHYIFIINTSFFRQTVKNTERHTGIIRPGTCRHIVGSPSLHILNRISWQLLSCLKFYRNAKRVADGVSIDHSFYLITFHGLSPYLYVFSIPQYSKEKISHSRQKNNLSGRIKGIRIKEKDKKLYFNSL